MGPQLLLVGIPVFIVAITADVLADRTRPRRFYQFADTLNDLSMGISQQVGDVFVRVAIVGAYAWIYHRDRLVTLHGAADIAAGMVLYDFFYYWAHRAMHEVNVLWAGHAPHHQSEEYNLAVALRQGAFQGVTSCFFYWPMALLGVSPWSFLLAAQVSLIYQFWPHTRAVGKLGVLEAVLNTPSHHRVHHGRNRKYLDRNHGGILIVWDRLFGTFQVEEEDPTYGTVERLQSWNPLWAQVKYLVMLGREARAARRGWDAVRVWFARTGWVPGSESLPVAPEVSPDEVPYDPVPPAGLRTYALTQFLLMAPLVGMLLGMPGLATPLRLVLAVGILLGLETVGACLEARRWVLVVEPLRLGLLAVGAFWLGGPAVGAVTALVTAIQAGWFLRLRPGLRGVPAR